MLAVLFGPRSHDISGWITISNPLNMREFLTHQAFVGMVWFQIADPRPHFEDQSMGRCMTIDDSRNSGR